MVVGVEDFKRNAIKSAVSGFDFTKAAMALAGCGWMFQGDKESPTAEKLEAMARKLCAEAIDSGDGIEIKHGPLQVNVHGWNKDEESAQARAVVTLRLELIPVFSHAVYVDFAHIDSATTER